MNQEALRSFVGEDQEAIKLSPQSFSYLGSIRKWTMFFSVLGFIGLGIMVIAAIVMLAFGSSFGNYPGTPMPFGMFGFIYLIFAVLHFFPVYYLYKFSSNIKNGLILRDEATLEEGFKYLKNHYQFVGILTIILISLYILTLIGILLASLAVGLSM